MELVILDFLSRVSRQRRAINVLCKCCAHALAPTHLTEYYIVSFCMVLYVAPEPP
jgi:hypothetical protein